MEDFSNKNALNTLYVGIDVDSLTNVVSAINFDRNLLYQNRVKNDINGVETIKDAIIKIFNDFNDLKFVDFILESTGIYSYHTANYLSTFDELLPYHPIVYVINPKISANFRKQFIDESKNDIIDSVLLANIDICGILKKTHPWKGAQSVALQRLTRHRKHVVDLLIAEKTYLISNIFLKFSGLLTASKDDKPFSNIYGATSSSILTDFFSLDELVNYDTKKLVELIQEKGNKHFTHPEIVADKIKQAANNSYQLDKLSAEPISLAISSSFNIISAYQSEIKSIDKNIERLVKGLNENEYKSLCSIPGIGPTLAAGIISEIGSINQFPNDQALAKYAGLFWKDDESGKFKADDTHLAKAGNSYLRYYLVEAAFSVKNHVLTYNDFYNKKLNEVKIHKDGRARVLTARKLVKLIFALMSTGNMYKE